MLCMKCRVTLGWPVPAAALPLQRQWTRCFLNMPTPKEVKNAGPMTTKTQADFVRRSLMITQPVDLSWGGVKRFVKKQIRDWEYSKQLYSKNIHGSLPVDLASTTFVLNMGGKVKLLGYSFWIHNMHDHDCIIPVNQRAMGKVQAINMSRTKLMYHGIDNLLHLQHLKWLSVKDCPNFDDWCLNRVCVEFRDSLEYLDVSGCPLVTERGLASVHKATKLQTLVMEDLPKLKNAEFINVLVANMLPKTHIAGYLDTEPPEIKDKLLEGVLMDDPFVLDDKPKMLATAKGSGTEQKNDGKEVSDEVETAVR